MGQCVEKFEDLTACQKARVLTKGVYVLTSEPALSRDDFGLKDQMQRAAVSIVSNVAEGFERNRPAEFHQSLSVAKGSCGELRSQLVVALEACYLDQMRFDELMSLAVEVSKIVGVIARCRLETTRPVT